MELQKNNQIWKILVIKKKQEFLQYNIVMILYLIFILFLNFYFSIKDSITQLPNYGQNSNIHLFLRNNSFNQGLLHLSGYSRHDCKLWRSSFLCYKDSFRQLVLVSNWIALTHAAFVPIYISIMIKLDLVSFVCQVSI